MRYARPVQIGETVRVHKNLSNGRWVICARVAGKSWQAIQYADAIELADVTPVVSVKSVDRIRKSGDREVVAKIQGIYLGTGNGSKLPIEVRYNPFVNVNFYTESGDFAGSSRAVFHPQEGRFTVAD